MLFCPFCAQPESKRVEGNPGAGAQHITFACSFMAEVRYSGGYATSLLMQGGYRPLACIAFGNASPHRLNARITELEEILSARREG